MRKGGNICIAIGMALIVAALALVAQNYSENRRAQFASDKVMEQVVENIEQAELKVVSQENGTASVPDPYDPTMTEKEIDGIRYVGYLSIPVLELELPVVSEWSYENLKISPCRYSGSSKSDNLVIAAHNYRCHFGSIKSLKPGDEVVFTDMDGLATRYEVTATEVLNPTAVEDMTSGEYDLTLFTCTYGGENRITVRCDEKT